MAPKDRATQMFAEYKGSLQGLLTLFQELNATRSERALTQEEFEGLVYAAHYLCQPQVHLDTTSSTLDKIGISRIRLEAAEQRNSGNGALVAARALAEVLSPTAPDEARMILRRVIDKYADDLVQRPLVLAKLSQLESPADAIRTVEPRVLAVLQDANIGEASIVNRATLHGLLVDLYLAIGNTDDAAKHVELEAELARQSGNSACLGASAFRRASQLLATNRMEAADRFLSKIFDESPDWLVPNVKILLTRQRGLARAELYREDREQAELGLEDLNAAIQSSFPTDAERITALGSKTMLLERLERRSEAAEAYAHLNRELDRLRAEGLPAPAAAACIAGIMRARLSKASAAEVRDELEACVAEHFSRIMELAPRPGGSGFLLYGAPRDLISELVERCLEAEPGQAGLERALSWILKSQALGSMARLEGYEFRGLDEVREALVSKTRGVLVYLPSPIRTHVFGFDSESLWHETLERAWKIEQNREAFLDQGLYSNERGALYDSLAKALAEDVIPARVLAHMADWTELSIGGLGLTDYIPYEVLPFDERQSFGQRFDVAYLPSVPIGEVLAKRVQAEPRADVPPIALFVAPTTPPGLEQEFPPILLSPEQRKRLGFERPEAVKVWEADQASFANLIEAASSGARILHLFMHGDPDPRRARPAGLLFAAGEGGPVRVSCRDIERLEKVPPVVVLSVCGAQKGNMRKGEDGLTHLGGAFLAAGAQAVILSPDDLEVDATLALVANLQDRLLREEAPASALAGAIADLRRDSAFDDPKHASMHVLGLGFRAVP